MAEVRLRAAADADLVDILEYSVRQFGEAAAEDYLRSFDRACDLLARHPHAGAVRTDLEPPIHSLHHRSHRIFYDVEDEIVWIVRVLHHAIDERSWLQDGEA